MAILNVGASHRTYRSTDVSNGLAVFLVALSVVCGLFSFVLCLAAEGSRTEATRYIMSGQVDGNSDASQCAYNASGRRPLTFAVGAFLLLVVAMFAVHVCMLVVVTSPQPPPASVPGTPQPSPSAAGTPQPTQALIAGTPEDPRLARLLFLASWISFATAEALLMIGMAVESSHICQWAKPRSSCHVIRPGLFAVAGVFGLLTVLLGIALYITASRKAMQRAPFAFRPPGARPPTTPTPSAPPGP